MPKSKREQIAVILTLELLIQGIFYEISELRRLPFSPALVTRVLKALQDSKVIDKLRDGKYLFNDEFLRVISDEVYRAMPPNALTQPPVMTIFDVCKIEEWEDSDFESFIERLRRRRLELKKWRADGVNAFSHG